MPLVDAQAVRGHELGIDMMSSKPVRPSTATEFISTHRAYRERFSVPGDFG